MYLDLIDSIHSQILTGYNFLKCTYLLFIGLIKLSVVKIQISSNYHVVQYNYFKIRVYIFNVRICQENYETTN